MERESQVYLDSKGKPILNGKDPKLNAKLFEEYIMPKYDMVLSLTKKYTDFPENVDENFCLVLTEFYKYIQSYNPERPLHTWIHIVTRRCVQEINKKRYDERSKTSDNDPRASRVAMEYITTESFSHDHDMSDCLSDEIVTALRMIQPHKLSAFILQVQGYSIEEITNIEFTRGHLKRWNKENVKSRIFQARQELKEILNRDGTLKSDLLKMLLLKKIQNGAGETNESGSDFRPTDK